MLLSMEVFETIKNLPSKPRTKKHFVLLEHDSEGHQLLFK
jgi:hypothetical protein